MSKKPPISALIGDGLFNFAGWLLLAALVAAPMAYGGFRSPAMTCVAAGLALIAVAAIAGWLFKGRLPRMPMWGWASAAALGGWMFVSLRWAEDHFLTASSRELIGWHLERWPASTLMPEPLVSANLVAALCVIVVLSADLARRSRWRVRFLAAIAISGLAVAALGLAQVATGAESVYWESQYNDQRDIMPGHFFGPFFHHSVAGAYLNIAWPAAAALAAVSWLGRGQRRSLAAFFWMGCAFVIFASVFVNVSKAAMVFAILLLLAGVIWPGRLFVSRARAGLWKTALPVGVVALGVVAAGIWHQADRFAVGVERWREFVEAARTLPEEMERTGRVPTAAPFDRLAGLEIAWNMAQDSGWRGFGPASWMRTFPDYMGEEPLEPFWLWMQFTHQDYLQALIEWGWVGAFLGMLVFIGGYFRGARSFKRLDELRFSADGVALYAILLALTATGLHAMGDFPFQIPAVQLAVAVLVGISWSASFWRVEKPADSSARS